MTRRPSKLTDPLPGPRCPACWCPVAFLPSTANVCPRCFALVGCFGLDVHTRLDSGDLVRLSPAHRVQLLRDRSEMIAAAASRWRTLPRTPSRPLQQR